MKKIILIIFSWLILFSIAYATVPLYRVTFNGVNFANPVTQTTWYVTNSGAGAKNGTDQADAWAISGISWSTVKSYDQVDLCGNIPSDVIISKSGNGPTLPLTINGACPSNAAIIDGANTVPNSWTLVSSNVYSTPMANGVGPYSCTGGSCGIVTEDDAALIDVPWDTDAPTTIADMVSASSTYSLGTWAYDLTNGVLYVLTTDASTPAGHTIEASYGGQYSSQLIMTNQSNVLIENITLKNAGDYGIDITGGSNNVITGSTIYNIKNWGIFVGGSAKNMTVNNNTLHHVVWQEHAPTSVNIGVGEGIRYYGVTGGSVHDNTIYNNPSIGIDLYLHTTGVSVYNNTIHDNLGMTANYSTAIYSDNSQNNFIYNNLIYNEIVGIELDSEVAPGGTSGTYVYNNLIYNWYYSGMYLGFGSTYINSLNNFVLNNTFVYGPGQFTYGLAIYLNSSEDDTFQNNAVFGVVGYEPSSVVIFGAGDFDYNTYMNTTWTNNTSFLSLSQWQGITSGEAHSTLTTPSLGSVFVNASSLNFNLVSGAPPISQGLNFYSIFTTDYNYTMRPSTGPWDNGAINNI